MNERVAARRIESFRARWGAAHMALACHASVPLALTPDLTYRIWANFQRDVDSRLVGCPWVAVADLLLSPLCDEIGEELYAMPQPVRAALTAELEADPRFGRERVLEVADLLTRFVRQQLHSEDPDERDLAIAQHWAGTAHLEPARTAADLAKALDNTARAGGDVLRLTSMVEHLAEPLTDYPALFAYAEAHTDIARGRPERAGAAIAEYVDRRGRLVVAGLPLEVPAGLVPGVAPPTEAPAAAPAQAPRPVGRRWAVAVGADGKGGFAPLLRTESDAAAVGRVLRASGYSVHLLVGAQSNRTALLGAFDRTLAEAGPDDVVVFYFGGHSFQHEGRFTLVLNDFDRDDPATGLALAALEDRLRQSPVSRSAFVLDTHAGAGGQVAVNVDALAGSVRGDDSIGLLTPVAAYEEARRGGVFTFHLIEGLRGAADRRGDGRITLADLADYVRPRLAEETSPDQVVFAAPAEAFPLVERAAASPAAPPPDAGSLPAHIETVRAALRPVAQRPHDPALATDPSLLSQALPDLAVWLSGVAAAGGILFRLITGAGAIRSDGPRFDPEVPGRVWLRVEPGAPLVPIQAAYSRPLDPTSAATGPDGLCPGFVSALFERIPLAESMCFTGACPSREDPRRVCPSGFLGYRHSVTLGAGDLRRRRMVVTGAPTSLVWTQSLPDSSRALLARLGSRPPDVVWLRDAGPDEPFIVSKIIPRFEPPALVAVDSLVGSTRPPGSADALLSRLDRLATHGALYSEVPVHPGVAAAVRDDFLPRFLGGVSADEALRLTRLALLAQGSAAGLAYALVGAPSLEIVPDPEPDAKTAPPAPS